MHVGHYSVLNMPLIVIFYGDLVGWRHDEVCDAFGDLTSLVLGLQL